MTPTSTVCPSTASEIVSDLSKVTDDAFTHFQGLQTFKPLPTDIFIGSWMKSGTTLLQNLTYKLFSYSGNNPTDPTGEDFNDISEVVPFVDFEEAKVPPHRYQPRVWKTHSAVSPFLKPGFETCRYIYCVRDGRKVAPSFMDFVLDWILPYKVHDKQLRIDTYHLWFKEWFLGIQDPEKAKRPASCSEWFQHLSGWLNHAKQNPSNVYVFVYDEAIRDLSTAVRQLANFIGIEVDDDIVQRVVQACSKEKNGRR